MFLEFYKLPDDTFGVTPDPRRLYLSRSHREALASLVYGLKCNRGFLTLIAKPGMGKTTLLFYLLEQLRNSARTALIFDTQCNPSELLRHMLTDLGIRPVSTDKVAMHYQLNDLLLAEAKRGRQVVAMIDEAQNLSEETLESVRLLSNFENPSAKLIQIILAGQPPLADKLSQPCLDQLQQRVAIMAHLEPFSRDETARYIQHRLNLSGYRGPELFDSGALDLIADLSQGIPRRINALCFDALSIGCALRKETIDSAIIREAAADLEISSLHNERPVPKPIEVAPPPAAPTGNGVEPKAPEPEEEEKLLPIPEWGSRDWVIADNTLSPVRCTDGPERPAHTELAATPQPFAQEDREQFPAVATEIPRGGFEEEPWVFRYPEQSGTEPDGASPPAEPESDPCTPGLNDPLPVYTLPANSDRVASTPNLASQAISGELRELGWGLERDWHVRLGLLLIAGGFVALWQHPPLLMLAVALWVAGGLILMNRKRPPESWEQSAEDRSSANRQPPPGKAGSKGRAIGVAVVSGCLIAILCVALGRPLKEGFPAVTSKTSEPAVAPARTHGSLPAASHRRRRRHGRAVARTTAHTQGRATSRASDSAREAMDSRSRRFSPAAAGRSHDKSVRAILEQQAHVLRHTGRRTARQAPHNFAASQSNAWSGGKEALKNLTGPAEPVASQFFTKPILNSAQVDGNMHGNNLSKIGRPQ